MEILSTPLAGISDSLQATVAVMNFLVLACHGRRGIGNIVLLSISYIPILQLAMLLGFSRIGWLADDGVSWRHARLHGAARLDVLATTWTVNGILPMG
jgi:hypothetical protein